MATSNNAFTLGGSTNGVSSQNLLNAFQSGGIKLNSTPNTGVLNKLLTPASSGVLSVTNNPTSTPITAKPVNLTQAINSGGVTLSGSKPTTTTTKPVSTGVLSTPTYSTPSNTTQNTSNNGLLNYNSTPVTPTPTAPVYTPPTTYTPNASLYGDITAGLANMGESQAYKDRVAAYEKAAQDLEDFKRATAEQTKNINESGTWTSRALGEQGQANIANAATEQALTNKMNSLAGLIAGANTQQGLQQSALTSAGNMAAPVAYTPQQTPFNPVTNQFVGGQSQAQRAVTGANVNSAADLTTQKNQIQSIFNGAEANFKLLVDTAKQGGVNDLNVPALNLLQQNINKGLTSSSAVINFRNTLATVRSQYAQILGGGTTTVDSQNRAQEAIPDNISLGALQSLEQQLRAEGINRIAGIDNQIKSLVGGTNNAGTITTPSGLVINPNF